jgi:predicted nucleic acid-binding protein
MTSPLRFYVETSVWSRVVDRADPIRRRATRAFLEWARPRHFLLTSRVVLVELRETRDRALRHQTVRKFQEVRARNVSWTLSVDQIAWDLVELGCVSENDLADALHLAYALIGKADALVTWNLADLARPHTRQIVRDYCWRHGLPEMRIGDPIEVGRWLDVRIR